MASTKSADWKKYWDERRRVAATAKEFGLCTVRYRHTSKGGKVVVSAPFNVSFATRAREIGGTWRKRTETWVFTAASRRIVLELCKQVYGSKVRAHLPTFSTGDEPPQIKEHSHDEPSS